MNPKSNLNTISFASEMQHSVMTFSLHTHVMQITQKKETHFRSGRVFRLQFSGASAEEHDSQSPSKLTTNNKELQNK
jgi:hypothetical protein